MLTSQTTGESHIVITDENGMISTASSWNPHSYNTNSHDAALVFVASEPSQETTEYPDRETARTDEKQMETAGDSAFDEVMLNGKSGEISDENQIESTEDEASDDSHLQSKAEEASNDVPETTMTVDETMLDPSAGIWFNGRSDAACIPDDDLGALPYDTYTVTELPVSA